MGKILKIRDANVYVNGTSTHGQSTEVVLPNVEYAKGEHKALGMIGTRKFFQGVNAMDCTIKWSSPDNDVKLALSNPMVGADLMIRSSRDRYEGNSLVAQEPVIYYIKGSVANYNVGTFKSKEDTETETKIDVSYFKEVANGQEIIEIDVDNNIFRIKGEDIMAQYRKNLGL